MRKERKTIAILVAVFALCLLFVNTTTADDSLSVTTPAKVSIVFDQPRATTPTFTASTSLTITNNINKTVDYFVSDCTNKQGMIEITPSPSSGKIEPFGSAKVSLTITLSSSLDEGEHKGEVEVKGDGEYHQMDIPISITHKAKLEVSPTSVTFERIDATESRSKPKTVTFSEELGYKPITVTLNKRSGNEWMTFALDRPDMTTGSFELAAGGSKSITFSFEPSGITPDNCKRYYSWTYSVSSTEEAGISTINLKGEICCPAKLSYNSRASMAIKFNRPKTERRTYRTTAKIPVSNTGCMPMQLKRPSVTNPSANVTLSVGEYPSYVYGYDSGDIEIGISAPYYASEGTHRSTLYLDAGDAGLGEVEITIEILWPVDFEISSDSEYFTPSPPSIDFGSLELKDLGYERREMNLTLTETYLYKPVQNLRFYPIGEYGKWLNGVRNFYEIPPGESRNITVKIEPGLEAVPEDYSWNCDLSASEIKAKRIEVNAKIVPMNISMMIERFRSFRNSTIYTRYPSTENIISNGVAILELAKESEIGKEDWRKIPILTKGALSLLSALNDTLLFTDEKRYDKAVESLVISSVSLSSIDANCDLKSLDLSDYAPAISTGADTTSEEVMKEEAKMLELRGWDIKNAVAHAEAKGDIRGLTEEENLLNASLSYQYAATIYGPGLLSDKEKRLGSVEEESMLMDKHDELVSVANDLRFDVENMISDSKENDLVPIWDLHLLLNPYNYDNASMKYWLAQRKLDDASKKYVFAGERLMAKNTEEYFYELKGEWSYIFWLFIIMCLLYAAALIYTIGRIFIGTMAYIRDMHDREVGDIVVT
jgi:hypothetical protein